MNKDIVEGKWKQLVGRTRLIWGDWTGNPILRAEGNAQRLAGMAQERYGAIRDQARRRVREFMNKPPGWIDHVVMKR
jgi:uncharacterized protein YjbJ (UPF0337 family)